MLYVLIGLALLIMKTKKNYEDKEAQKIWLQKRYSHIRRYSHTKFQGKL